MKVAQEFSDLMLLTMSNPLSPEQGEKLKKQMLTQATKFMTDEHIYTPEQLQEMSPEEIVMRWIFALNERIHRKIEFAWSLPAPKALAQLSQIEGLVERLMSSIDAPTSPFPPNAIGSYVALHRFDRRVKLLQTAEAIRDHAAEHDGKLPAALDEMRLLAPLDPLTGKHFDYACDAEANTATLGMPELPGVEADRQQRRVYEITVQTD